MRVCLIGPPPILVVPLSVESHQNGVRGPRKSQHLVAKSGPFGQAQREDEKKAEQQEDVAVGLNRFGIPFWGFR